MLKLATCQSTPECETVGQAVNLISLIIHTKNYRICRLDQIGKSVNPKLVVIQCMCTPGLDTGITPGLDHYRVFKLAVSRVTVWKKGEGKEGGD